MSLSRTEHDGYCAERGDSVEKEEWVGMVYDVEEKFQGRVGEDRLGKDREENGMKGYG